MSQDSLHQIPVGIEKPTPILLWDPLDFVLAILAIGFGLVMDIIFVGIVAAALVLWGSLRMKRGAKAGAMQHALWSLGLQIDARLKVHFPASWANDYME